MQALAKIAPEDGGIAVGDYPEPTPGPGEIRIKVAAAGICGTDMQIYYWAPRMARRMTLPRIMGHEVSGVVDAVGPGAERIKVGDHVCLESHIYCGHCRMCRTGRAHLCQNLSYPGISIDGGFADYVVVPECIAWVNPPDMPHETAAMLEPYGIAVHATMEGPGVAGRRVLINGCGPIGLMNVAVARAMGAAAVVAVDVNPLRLAMAEKMGADRTLNAAEDDVPAAVLDMTQGYGADVSIEYSGQPQGFDTALACLSKGGEFRLVGGPAQPHAVDFTRWLATGITVYSIHGRRIWDTWEHGVALLESGRIDLSPVASHTLPLSEAPRGFELIKAGEALKPIIIPD